LRLLAAESGCAVTVDERVTPRRFTATRPKRDTMASGDRIIRVFMREALPKASDATRALAADLIPMTFSALGK
jgi:hypothetical protein